MILKWKRCVDRVHRCLCAARDGVKSAWVTAYPDSVAEDDVIISSSHPEGMIVKCSLKLPYHLADRATSSRFSSTVIPQSFLKNTRAQDAGPIAYCLMMGSHFAIPRQ